MCCRLVARLLQNSALGLDGMGDLRHGLLDLTDTDLTDKVPAAPQQLLQKRTAQTQTQREFGWLRRLLTTICKIGTIDSVKKKCESKNSP